MKQITKIYFIHEGKESYPEIAAYRAFFVDRFETQEIHPDHLAAQPDLDCAVCWFIMGFYRKHLKAGLVVHDYRSLSIGRLRVVKDLMKRWFNVKPDIRIFQNRDMEVALALSDTVPTVYLPMGVPETVMEFRAPQPSAPDHDFCYIGVMSMERRSYLMLDSFLKRFGDTKTFHLYGAPEEAIVKRYASHPNIVFMGRKPQADVFKALQGARVAVNYFPNHNPHKLQTPTKLLEYAALGLRILCNEQPQSRACATHYGFNCLWGDACDMFTQVPDILDWPNNATFDPRALFWPSIIAESGIVARIENKGCL